MRFKVRINAQRVFFDTAGMTAEARRMAQHASKRMKARIRRKPRSSAPGQSPHGKMGTLRRSIGYKRVKGDGIGYWVGARSGGPGSRSGGASSRDGFYGRFLQFGTKNLKKRDFVDATIDAERGFIEQSLAGAAERGVKVRS